MPESGRTERGVDARCASRQRGQCNPGAEAVGQVKGITTDLQRVSFFDSKVPLKRGIEPEIMRAWDIVAAQTAERARRGAGECGRINPATRARVGAQRIRQYLNRPFVPAIAVQRYVSGEVGRNPVRGFEAVNRRDLPIREQPGGPGVREFRSLIHRGQIEDLAAVGRECSADFVRLAVAAIVVAVGWNRQALPGVAGTVADGKIADAVGPSIVRIHAEAVAEAFRKAQQQAVIA